MATAYLTRHLPRAQDAPPPPAQLPDVSPMRDELATALDQLGEQWGKLSAAQKQQLVDQVQHTATHGQVEDLPDMQVDTDATAAALAAAMVAVAAVASRQLVTEAAEQGIELSMVHLPHSHFAPAAAVIARLLGDELRIAAARAALHTGTGATPQQVADAAQRVLDGLSTAGPDRELGGALHGAMNAGRHATFTLAPEGAIYAQEMNDANTCGPCREVDGRWLGNVPSDLAQIELLYPGGGYGGYVDCLGGIRCRGTVVGVWRPETSDGRGGR